MVGDDSEACSKVTVPPTVESPRRTATVFRSGGEYVSHYLGAGRGEKVASESSDEG